MKLRVVMLACLAAVFAAASSAYGQDATLRYRWAKGDDIRYRVSQLGSTTISGLPGMDDMTVNQSNIQVVRMTVDDVAADGVVTLHQTFESVRMEMSSPAGKMVFDSTSPDKPADPVSAAMGATMSAMIGESITIVLAPTGTVTKVEGMSRIFDKVMKSMPQDQVAAQVSGQLKASLGDDAMKAMFAQSFATFPDHPVKPGETWTGQFSINNPMLGATTTTRTSTFQGIDTSNGSPIARIGVLLVVKRDPGAAPTSPMGMTVNLGDSKSKGEILFDVTRGRVQKSTLETDLNMTMAMPTPDGGQIETKNSGRVTVTMEIVEK
jgi:hypothetical protein